MSWLDVAAALAVLAGAVLQSAVGFGFAMVSAPVLFAAAGPQQAVGLLTVLAVEVNLVTLFGEGRRPQPLGRMVAVVLAWSVPGLLAGVALLRSVDPLALQVTVTVAVFASLAVQHLARTRPAGGAPRPLPRWATPAAGVASGALTTTTGTGGPPLVLLLLGRGHTAALVRDTLAVSFLALALLAGVVLAATGTRGAAPEVAWLMALVPLAAAGQLAGRPLFHRLSGGRYEAVLTAVLTLSALTGLLAALL